MNKRTLTPSASSLLVIFHAIRRFGCMFGGFVVATSACSSSSPPATDPPIADAAVIDSATPDAAPTDTPTTTTSGMTCTITIDGTAYPGNTAYVVADYVIGGGRSDVNLLCDHVSGATVRNVGGVFRALKAPGPHTLDKITDSLTYTEDQTSTGFRDWTLSKQDIQITEMTNDGKQMRCAGTVAFTATKGAVVHSVSVVFQGQGKAN